MKKDVMNLEKITKYRAIVLLLISVVLTGCSTYSSSFSCGDAKGATCISMDRVDRMIASGEIENFNEKRKNCRGRRCKENRKYDTILQPVVKEVDYQLSNEAI